MPTITSRTAEHLMRPVEDPESIFCGITAWQSATLVTAEAGDIRPMRRSENK